MTREQKFFNKLSEVFIGAKVEGRGGFINLMRIKSKYYEKIEKVLKEDIEKALEKYPDLEKNFLTSCILFFQGTLQKADQFTLILLLFITMFTKKFTQTTEM